MVGIRRSGYRTVGEFPRFLSRFADNEIMTSQVIVPHRPGPLVEVPDENASGPADGPADGPAEPRPGLFGAPEIMLTVGGGGLLVAVLLTDLPGWLTVVAVACLSLGLALPAHAALLAALRRRGGPRPWEILRHGLLLDVSDPSVRRLVAAYGRLARTSDAGMALDAAHLALVEVAEMLSGRPPRPAEKDEVIARAVAVSNLADRLAEGPVMPVELLGADSLERIKALLA
jgi:hypothetical protein